ncbi:S-adenosyl-L-methionine-dependent methyltransferase [Halenospora varia]|nr:S-adenosyl-L-methionine-dependent methyltransferase [Halenospora varia]
MSTLEQHEGDTMEMPLGEDHVMSNNEATTAAVSMASAASSSSAEESALQHLNVDYSDHDSAIGGMTPHTSTMSVNSSIYNYIEENGRTYHRYKEGKYMLPNDEAEMDRLDLQHHLWLITLYDQLQLAPISNPQNVLDIGTGTGIWAIEFANKHPSAQVIGSDLSPIQPTYVPPNCQFEVDDAEDEWNYSQRFDLIHGRALVTCFKDPGTVISSAFKALIPGGYLEFQDVVLPMRAIDDTIEGTALQHWQEKTIASAATLGTSWKNSGNYTRYFEDAGFVDVVEQHFQWPMNTWPKGTRMKTLGTYWQEDMLRGLEALSMAVLTRGGGMKKEEVLELTAEVRKDIHNKNIHAYLPIVVVYGRKPEHI